MLLGRDLLYLPTVYCAYLTISVVANLPVRDRLMVLMPLYALAQSLLLPLVGTAGYGALAVRQGSLGRYRLPYLARFAGLRGRG